MTDMTTMVADAAAGDQQAWAELVRRFTPMLRSTARGFRLGDEERADALQTTWLVLFRHIGHIRDPERLGAWLWRTMRNECLRIMRNRKREMLVDDWADVAHRGGGVDGELLRAERDRLLWQAVDQLPEPQRQLVRALWHGSEPSYRRISADLSMAVGSIGPTRARALQRLAELLAERGATRDLLSVAD